MYYNNRVKIKRVDNDNLTGYDVYAIDNNVETFMVNVPQFEVDELVVAIASATHSVFKVVPVYKENYKTSNHNVLI